MINGSRLKQAREAKGLTQSDLATLVDLPQPVISRLEIGNYPLENEEIVRLANRLEVPVQFLFRAAIELPDGSLGLFRSTSSKVKAPDYRAARRLAELGVEAILRLAEDIPLPPCRLKVLPDEDIERVAEFARSMLRLPAEEPIENLTLAAERAGVFMLRLSNVSDHITGFSAWIDPIPSMTASERPMIVLRRGLTAFRVRFTVAHELGHLLLGHQVFTGPKRPVENEANLFAQALLMPKDAALEDLSTAPLTLERLAELKSKWGFSMHGLAMRAKYLKVINEFGYRSIYETLRAQGFLKQEPGDLMTVPEQPRLLNELLARRKLRRTSFDLAGELNISLFHARSILGDDSAPRNEPLLR